MAHAYYHVNVMQQGHQVFLIVLLIGAMSVAGCAGTTPALNNTSASASAMPATFSVNFTSAADYLYLSMPGCTGDNTTLTAQVYENGQPYAKAGVPVAFQLDNDKLATLGQTQVLTDSSGKASVSITAGPPDTATMTYPYNVTVKATANNAMGSLAIPMTRHVSLSGKATDRKGEVVEGAAVKLVFNATGALVRAPGNPQTTGSDGKYYFACLPVDMGNIELIVEKGSLFTTLPVNFTNASHTT